MVVNDKKYLEYFYKISKILRRSGEEKDIANFIIEFAKEHNYEYYTDDFYNVIVWKEASQGYETKEVIGLQAHTDMICEKNDDVKHNFENGVDIYEDNGYLMARGTSLGADNGIGVAYLLAILDSQDIKHPKIEAIFTSQEETTMDGVRNIDKTKLFSKKIISFDNFSANDIWIGSASSKEWETDINMNLLKTDRELVTYKLDIQNFLGGHSGIDIKDSKRGNPIKIASEILKDETIFINNIEAGSAINVIPRNCTIVFSTYQENEQQLVKDIDNRITIQKSKYPIGNITIEKMVSNTIPFDTKSSKAVLDFIYDFKNGVLALDTRGNVIVSSNFAKITTGKQNINLKYAIRSNKENICQRFIKDVQNLIEKYKLNIINYEVWKGYEQNEDTELINICRKNYIEVIGKEPNILGVQACLECEFLNDKIQDLQYVALGTNIYGAHSTKEKVEILSIENTWKVLIKILENI